jgi:hypothetical protein
VVEFTYKSDVDHILNVSSYVNKKEVIPVRSPFLWFRAPKKALHQKHSSSQLPSLVETNGNSTPTPVELRILMQGAESVSLNWIAVTAAHMGDNSHILLRCDIQGGLRKTQGVSERALQLWKSISIYSEDMYSVLKCYDIAKHTEFYLG